MAPLRVRFTSIFTNITSTFANNLGLIACEFTTLYSIIFHGVIITCTCFFSRFLESRNYKIQIVARVGRKSAVVLSGTMEASYPHFFVGLVFNCSRYYFLFLQKLPLTGLQALWEYQNRLLLEELYTIDEVIPPEDDF